MTRPAVILLPEWFADTRIPSVLAGDDYSLLTGARWCRSIHRYDSVGKRHEPIIPFELRNAPPDFHRREAWNTSDI